MKIKSFIDRTLNKEEMYLGNKRVKIVKLTPAKWKQLFGTVDRLPGLVIQVMTAPKEDFYAYVIEAVNISLDEVIDVVSVLTELDIDYVYKNVGVDEIVEYLVRMVKRNRLDTALKNVRSLLSVSVKNQ